MDPEFPNNIELQDNNTKHIQIQSNEVEANTQPKNLQNSNEINSLDPSDIIESQKQKIANSIVESATDKLKDNFIARCFSCCNLLAILKPYFKINNVDIFERLKISLIPLNRSFYESAKDNVDFYGPFWIATTLIFTIPAVGTLNKYFNVNNFNI